LSILGITQLSVWIAPLTLTVLALLAIALLVNRRKMEDGQRQNEKAMESYFQKYKQENQTLFSQYLDKLNELAEIEKTGFRKIYSDINDPDFIMEIKKLIQNANEIKIYSIAISVLWDPIIFSLLKKAVETRRAKVIILIANPKSKLIQQRLREEDQDEQNLAPKGTEHINRIFNDLKRLEKSVGDINLLDVRQFNHYPTFTLIIIDQDVFCYPYGYQTIGSVAPVLHMKGMDSRQVRYFHEQFDLLVKNCPRDDKLK
jgi:hypothetical protein